jgi:peptidylprolyl isomerase
MLLPTLLLTLLAQAAQEPRIPADTEVVTTPSGLAYSVLAPGKGEITAGVGDRVLVHFTGWLPDGTCFETTRGGKPLLVEIGRALPGWNEGLQLMRPGARYKLTLPPELAYGAVGRPPQIPSNATLVFEVELVEVLPLPKFHRAGEQQTTPSGLRYEELSPGDGKPVDRNHVVVVRYAMWDTAGTLLDCSENNADHRIKGKLRKLGEFELAFLEEAVSLMSAGARFRFEVPPALCFGDSAKPGLPASSTTVWELELERVLAPLPQPAFEEFDASRLSKLASGLEHYCVREGEGRAPERGDDVKLHYIGWLTSGVVFDDTYTMGEPVRLRLRDQIPGLVEGLQLVQPGGVHFFRIPSDLAYGAGGVPPYIGPRATLIFRVELLGVEPR